MRVNYNKSLFFCFKILATLALAVSFSSCVTTKYYNSSDTIVVSESESDSSIHYIKEDISIRADCQPDHEIIRYNIFGRPARFLWYTVRETGRVTFYTGVNVFSGLFSYYSIKEDGDIFGFYLPNIGEAHEEYDAMIEEYQNTDAYKYRKYMKSGQKAEITKTVIREEVNWDEEVETVSSTTETLFAKNDVKKSAAMMSKKASIVGSTIGKYTSYVVGIPGWFIGFLIGLASEN